MDRISIDVKDLAGGTLFSNFTNEEFSTFQKNERGFGTVKSKIRFGTLRCENFNLRCVTYSEDLINSSRLFNKWMLGISEVISFFLSESQRIENRGNQNLRRLVHNLTTYNALTQQEIELLLPQNEMASKTRAEQINFVKENLVADADEYAQTLLRITKYVQGIKAEISSFDKLFKKNPDLKIQVHKIHRVVMNTMYLFFPEFTDKQIDFSITPSELCGRFDYESINVALYHLINNAAKYCLSNSTLEVSISDFGKMVRVSIFMTSLRIEDSEKRDIFKEGYSGKYARSAELNGSGIGMYLVKALMELNQGTIDIKIDRSGCVSSGGLLYDKNTFLLDLPSTDIMP